MGLLLFAVIAVGLIGNGLQSLSTAYHRDCFQFHAESYMMNLIGFKNISPIGLSPKECCHRFLHDFSSVVSGQRNRLEITRGIGSNNHIGDINGIPRLIKIQVVRNFGIKGLNGLPCPEYPSSSAARIDVLRLKSVSKRLSIFIIDDELVESRAAYNSPQLFSRIGLSFTGNAPLLEYEPIAYGGRGDQTECKNRDGAGPIDHFPIKAGFGWGLIALAAWSCWSGISHFIYSEKRRGIITRSVAKIGFSIVLLWIGLYLL